MHIEMMASFRLNMIMVGIGGASAAEPPFVKLARIGAYVVD